jgi:lipoate-protein ligase A
MTTWRLIPAGPTLDPASGARNMAIDQALLESVAAGAPPVVRFYRWSPATLSFGRNQPARDRYDEAVARGGGIDFVRRPTGGQAVLHDDEVTYAVIAPIAAVGRPRVAYARINEGLVVGLRQLGVEAGPSVADPERRDWALACFRAPERGEVVVRGRKLVGSAQRTERRTILQHGSILLGGSQSPAEALRFDAPPGGGDPGWTTLESELGTRPEPEPVARSVARGLERVLGIQLAASSLSADERRGARKWTERYASPEWTWRR